jgi:hypothetical protein
LYVNGSQYSYSLKPNVTRLAADRAASNFNDQDADEEVKGRIARQSRDPFSAMQVFAEGPGDVPDDDDGVRLVVLSPIVTHQANDPASKATELAERILAQRDGGPRLNRNLLVFVAASVNRLSELRSATRMHLAWKSIVADHEALDMTATQLKTAETQMRETANQVESLIAETFTLALTPSQAPGTAEIVWQTTKVSTTGTVADRVAKKLATEEKLIQTYGGVRVKMDIDRYGLWTDRHDVVVRELWNTYARYPHLPRLASFKVLSAAISDGTSNLNWAQETFAYAEAHDGSNWVGVRTGEHVSPQPSGLIVDPNHLVIAPIVTEPGPGEGEPGPGGGAQPATATSVGKGAGKGGQLPTEFYALFQLDPVRAIRQLGDILEHVSNRLGGDVEFSLELRSTKPAGFDDATRRTVSENANNLGAKEVQFE